MAHLEIRGLSNADATSPIDHGRPGTTPQPTPKHRRLDMNKLITTTSRKTLARSFTAVLALAAMTAVTPLRPLCQRPFARAFSRHRWRGPVPAARFSAGRTLSRQQEPADIRVGRSFPRSCGAAAG